jgi:hypothetical protein
VTAPWAVRRVTGVAIRWVTAFIDRVGDSFDSALRFWLAATGSVLSAPRGDRDQFSTLLPSDGDPYLRAQRVQAGGGSHLDLHVDDVEAYVRQALAVGAGVERQDAGPVILRSPAGMAVCVVSHRGEARRPAPRRSTGGVLHLVDQLCIDIPFGHFVRECQFWSALSGWELRASSVRNEFMYLARPPGMPLRLLLQRRDDDDGPARAHLDIASDDVEQLVAVHQTMGATVAEKFRYWTAMADPSGLPYCITSRDPRTGVLP